MALTHQLINARHQKTFYSFALFFLCFSLRFVAMEAEGGRFAASDLVQETSGTDVEKKGREEKTSGIDVRIL